MCTSLLVKWQILKISLLCPSFSMLSLNLAKSNTHATAVYSAALKSPLPDQTRVETRCRQVLCQSMTQMAFSPISHNVAISIHCVGIVFTAHVLLF